MTLQASIRLSNKFGVAFFCANFQGYYRLLGLKLIEVLIFLKIGKCLYVQVSVFPANKTRYRKIASSNTSRLEVHVGFFRLLMKEIFGPYLL